MKLSASWRMVTCGVLVMALLFLVRPGANRLKTRIVNSISLALGRRIDVASVRLRALPQPGFDLENFVVHDDPAFGAEPMLRAREVTASLRWTSLLHGRLEISRLDFTEPSVNLVRSAEGQWNCSNLVERAQRIAVAPTAKVKTDTRPSFPYIEGSGGRINFKLGQEKKPYALIDADFSLWQESENQWTIRLKARPVRSDLNLSDTGIVQANGSWQRAASLRETPVQFAFAWSGAQLGQLSKLAYGNDKGWRGAIHLSATLVGTAANSTVVADASAEDFRRYDFITAETLRLQTRCSAQYSARDNSFSEIACRAPSGEGTIAVTGRVQSPFSRPNYDLVVALQDVPMQSLLTVARHANAAIKDDLSAEGHLDGEFRGQYGPAATTPHWEGSGQTSGFHLTTQNGTVIALGTVPFGISMTHTDPSAVLSPKENKAPTEPKLEIGPLHVPFGKPTPMTVQGEIWREGYDFEFLGEAQLKRFLEAARAIGIAAPQPNMEGSTKVDLQIAGRWSNSLPPRIVGSAQVRGVRAQVRGFNAPLEIGSTSLILTQDEIRVHSLVASAVGTSWRGSLLIARPCVATDACAVNFNLHADEVDVSRLNQLLNPHATHEAWYRALSSTVSEGTPYLMTINAFGKLNVDRLIVGKLVGQSATANVELESGKLRLSNFQASLLDGRHSGEWAADFTMKPPQFSGSGVFEHAELEQLADVMNENWIAGSGTVTYRASASGLTSSELISSATANLQIDVTDGVLPHVMLTAAAGPLQIRRLLAHLQLHEGKLDFRTGQIETGDDIFHLSGTVSLAQILDLKLTRSDASGFSVTGSLNQPHISQLSPSETRAALRP